MTVDKKSLSERDICTQFITPAIQQAGWDLATQVREEVTFTNGRVIHGTWERGDANFNPGDPAWASWYQEQVLDPFAEMVTGTGARILWVGMPAVRDEADTLQLVALNSQFRALAERDDRVEYVEGGDFLNGPDGGYTDELPRADGTPERVRRLDGLHLCPGGSERLAIPVVQYAQQEWEVAVGYNWQNAPWREPPTLDHPEECPPV